MVRCPECQAEVQPNWDWCHACGWDPEGLRPSGSPADPTGAPASPGPAAAPGRPPIGAPSPPVATPGNRPGDRPADRSTVTRSGPDPRVLVIGAVAGVAVVGVVIAALSFLGSSSSTPVAAPATTRAPAAAPTTSAPPPTAPPLTAVPGPWATWSSPDGRWSVDLPGAPVYTDATSYSGDATFQQTVELEAATGNYEIRTVDWRGDAIVYVPEAMTERQSLAGVDLFRVREPVTEMTTLAGLPARRTTGCVQREKQRYEAAFIVGTSGLRTYVLFASDGPEGKGDLDQLIAGFRPS